uniref:Endosomal/vacuolar adapter protein YPT35 n=1 Tax=Psilocybe cubensis TaxID=181762 RepID=A0A8H8CE75_PSICU
MERSYHSTIAEDAQDVPPSEARLKNPPKLMTRSPSSTVSVSSTVARASTPTSSPKSTKNQVHQSGNASSISDRDPDADSTSVAPQNPTSHPFAHTTAKLVLIPSVSTVDGIDVEEEARLYDELSRTYEDETDDFTRSNTPVRTARPAKQSSSSRPRPRSLPPESIFSADIFLADNTGNTPAGAAPLFAQDVRIAGWSTVGDGGGKFGSSKTIGGSGAYVVYDCVITTREGTTMHVLKRYSAFEELRSSLKRTLPSSLLPLIPSLPPKSALGRFRPAFLDSRRKLLQFFLASVLLHPEIGGRDVVRKWVLS